MKTFILGLLITMGAAGGVETSQDNVQLVQCLIVALVGLTVMWAGTDIIKHG